jgi:hypothetical protein
MSEKRQITNETILHAQAMQMAVALSKKQPQFIDGNAVSIERALDGYKDDAIIIFRYLLNHFGSSSP